MTLSDWERTAWKPPPVETIDEWAERAIVLPRGVSSMPGPLSLELTPYLREPLRSLIDPEVEVVVLCTSTQVGKTTALLLSLLYFVAMDPWNMIWVMPTINEAIELKTERVIPIINASPGLKMLLDDRGKGQMTGQTLKINEVTATFRGSNSASGVSSKPGKLAIGDEIDKWAEWTGKEAAPLDLLEERLKTFHDSKLVVSSTPLLRDGPIMRQLHSSTNERYHVPCPLCGEYQVLVFGGGTANSPGIKWPRDVRDPDVIERDNLAWYECQYCHERIEESHKRQMVSSGVWCQKGCTVNRDGQVEGEQRPRKKVGYHIWAAYSLWPKASWSRIAGKWLRSKDIPASRMDFNNSWLAQPWEVTVSELKDAHVRKRASDYWVGEIPAGALWITFGVDVQSTSDLTYQYYVVRAWGPGGVSWLVKYGRTSGWDQLYSVVYETDYATKAGSRPTKLQPLIDSGYRTSEVYTWCNEHAGIATKGDSSRRRHINFSEIPRAPESDELIPFVSFDPNYYKTDLHRQIKEAALWHLPREMDEEYYAHMIAEQQVRVVERKTGRNKTEWKLRSDGLSNHYFDCEVLCQVMADLAEIKLRPAVEEEAPKESPRREEPTRQRRTEPRSAEVRTFS